MILGCCVRRYDFFCFFPVHAKGRIGEHVIKPFVPQTIYRKGITELDIGRVLPFDQHVGFADRVGFRVDLLPEYLQVLRSGLNSLRCCSPMESMPPVPQAGS